MTTNQEQQGKTCSYRSPDDRKCVSPLHDQEHCIFHSKDIDGKKNGFNERFWQEFARQKAHEEVYDFGGFIFPGEISFTEKEFDKEVIFRSARFLGKVKFGRAQFIHGVSFKETRFLADVSFWDTKFMVRAEFSSSQFSKPVDFRQAKFFVDAKFEKAHFSRRADFWAASFHGKADFSQGNFAGEAIFREAEFTGDAGFKEVKFIGKISFKDAIFSKGAAFIRSRFSAEASFVGAQFQGKTNFSLAEFNDTAVFEKVDFKGDKDCYMEETYFYDVNGLLEFLEENLEKKAPDRRFTYSHRTEYLPDHFRLILGVKAAAKYPIIDRKIKDDLFLLDLKKKYPNVHSFWGMVADFGRIKGYKRWLAWSLGTAFFFAGIYALLDYLLPGSFCIKGDHTVFSYIYFSFVTFTTLGFGDITPLKWYAQIPVTIEVIIGYGMLGVLIGLLTYTLTRKS